MSDPGPRPPIATAPISVILCAQSLSTESGDAIQAWRAYLDKLRRPHEIILIQETRPKLPAGSDAPPESAGPERTMVYERDVGVGAAFNEAIRSAEHPLLVFCSCDKQYSPADTDEMLRLIDQVDLVVGYRVGGQAPPWRVLLDIFEGLFFRILLGMPTEPRVCWLGGQGWGRRWLARWGFGVRVHDPECPFRLARRSVFERLPIQSKGSFVPIEMLAKANHLGCYLAESPVVWTQPTLPASDAISFGEDAWLVFRDPDFGPAPAPG